MKKTAWAIAAVFLVLSCNNTTTIEKPDNLIDKEVMTNIFYDLALLEAMRSQNPYAPQNQGIDVKQYIYKKYKVDSLQLTQSNRYYVSQIEVYKQMYDKINQRLDAEKKAADSLLKKSGGKPLAPATSLPDTPQVQ